MVRENLSRGDIELCHQWNEGVDGACGRSHLTLFLAWRGMERVGGVLVGHLWRRLMEINERLYSTSRKPWG